MRSQTRPTRVMQPPMASRPPRRRPEAAGRAGNQAGLRRLAPPAPLFQAKLTIGAATDSAEREADRVADRVMAGGTAAIGAAPVGLARKCAACEGEEKLQTKPAGPTAGGAAAPGVVHQVLASAGRPLDGASRGFFEPLLGHDLSPVRVHEGPEAARSAAAVNALAYTVGHQIVLGGGGADRRLMAHELAHVVQQSGGAPALRRQEKKIGGPLDLKPDPCITLPGIGTRCGQEAVGLCEKTPGIPGCSVVCKILGCTKKNDPKTACKPGWRAATSKDFAGQCCLGAIDNAQDCCPPERTAMLPTPHCCAEGETVDPTTNTCLKSSDLPPLPPGLLCPPAQQTAGGKCCVPPMVPLGAICTFPDMPTPKPPAPPPSGPQAAAPSAVTIHFQKDHPGPGEANAGLILTPSGQAELAALQAQLTKTPELKVTLAGHASSEGDAAYNQALATRRVQFIAGKVGARTGDPATPDAGLASCAQIGKGVWSCGESQADQSSANAEDRVVRVTFLPAQAPSAQPAP